RKRRESEGSAWMPLSRRATLWKIDEWPLRIGVAIVEASPRQPGRLEETVLLVGQDAVLRTGWMVPAAQALAAQETRERRRIAADCQDGAPVEHERGVCSAPWIFSSRTAVP